MPYVLETLDPLKYCEVTDTYYIWDPHTGIWTDYSKISLEEHLSTTYRDTVSTACGPTRVYHELNEMVETYHFVTPYLLFNSSAPCC